MLYFLIFLVILLGGLLAFVENENARRLGYAVYLMGALPLLFFFAGTRSVLVGADSELYLNWYTSLINGTLPAGGLAKDPAFAIIGFSLHALGLGFSSLLAVYSGLCLWGQFTFIKRAVDSRWVALGFFLLLCRFYIPHEMTQIRASIAIPLMSLAILQFIRHRIASGIGLYLMALIFHLSTLLVFPLCILIVCGFSFRSRKPLFLLIGLAVAGHIGFQRIAPLLAVVGRTSDYINDTDVPSNSLLSVYFLLRLAMLTFVYLRLWPRLERSGRLLVFCSTLGLTLEAALSVNSSLAVRSAELFGLFDISVAILLLRYLSPKARLVYALVLLSVGSNFFRSALKIIGPYQSVIAAASSPATRGVASALSTGKLLFDNTHQLNPAILQALR